MKRRIIIIMLVIIIIIMYLSLLISSIRQQSQRSIHNHDNPSLLSAVRDLASGTLENIQNSPFNNNKIIK